MGASGTKAGAKPQGLTERQEKWFASVQATMARDTGKTLEEWVAIARTCPHDRPKARANWLREHHGLGINRASHVLSVAFPSEDRWDDPGPLRAKLWSDPASEAILVALEAAVAKLPDVTIGQRKAFTAFSRKVQMAAARPVKGGHAMVGFAVTPDADPRLSPRGKSESWGDRLKGQMLLTSPADVDGSVEALLKKAWERS
ncbi:MULTISPECIES: DUF4287 domain-containing protein [unclassified Phenylobacterium]|uniref:DUF4287 domain-containing protein n=1 Tax=unclassified Phenylobacterium TaxID=2640670 RepID=UPI00083B066B|nr:MULTISPECIES: DUF4287 domain-containing protein [unclassified Phenylobacterium]